MNITRTQCEELIDRLADKSCDMCLPVYLHRVLQKIDDKYGGMNYVWGRQSYNHETIYKWSCCGSLERSLQQIVEDSGWELPECIDPDCLCGKFPLRNDECEYKARLKSPEANALFTYLLELGL